MADLTDVVGWIHRIFYRLDRIEGGGTLENASVTNGRFRFIGGLLQGLAGAAFEWIGSVVTRGPFSNYGPFRNEGKFTNIGELEQQGPTRLIGGVDIEGLARLLNDLLLEHDGQITVSGVIDMLIKNGMITYANGATIRGSEGGVLIDSGSAQMQVATLVAALVVGLNSIRVEGTGTHVAGPAYFEDDAVVTGTARLAGRLEAANLTPLPIAGAASGTLVRLPGGDEVYVAL